MTILLHTAARKRTGRGGVQAQTRDAALALAVRVCARAIVPADGIGAGSFDGALPITDAPSQNAHGGEAT